MTLKTLEKFDWVLEFVGIFKTTGSKIVKIALLRIILQMIKIQSATSAKIIKNKQIM